MKKNNFLKILLSFVNKNIWFFIFYILHNLIFAVTFYLYQLPMESVLYAFTLCTTFGIIFFSIRFINFYKRRLELLALEKNITINGSSLPDYKDEIEKLYQQLIITLKEEQQDITMELENKIINITDYFTIWAHQIKTPIAGMDLILQTNCENDSLKYAEQRRDLREELFKIKQYVDMVLQYLKLHTTVNDFVFKEYDLDQIIKQAIHKYAGMIIRKRLKLNYEPINVKIITDEKWILFVIEQILSNAIKYTKSGSIDIYLDTEEDNVLIIEDTGIGILPEDIPRVFEKGYTGYNGRMDKKATGIGLYLCQLILKRLSHTITIESKITKGTKVKLYFKNNE